MNYKIILIILLILFLLGNYFRESFTDTETQTHYLLNSSIQTTTFQLTNIISRSASGDKEDDFKNLYTPFGKEHFDQNADYEQGQLPILVLESYKECPTLHTLYKSLKKFKTGGYEQNENVEGYRFRSLIQSVFYNITEPIEVDYKLFDMFVKDKFKEDLSNNQPNLKLKLYEQDINNNILINRLNSIKGPGIPEITDSGTLFTLHDHFELKITINITDDSSPESILFITDDIHNKDLPYIDEIRSSIDFYINAGKLNIGINDKAGDNDKRSYIIVETNGSNEYVITIKKQSNRIEVTKGDDSADKLNGQGITEYRFMKNASDLRTGGVFHIYTGSNYGTKYTISNFSYRQLNTELSYLDSEQPQYSFNHKEATFGVQENFERIDILRFMDFAFTTLCWGALHINLLKPLDNHFYAFPCQNSNCNTISNKPHFFYLLPVKVRQICYEEGSEYTRAKCNGCASNIIVFFNQVPNKFKNLSHINQTDQNKSIISTVLIT